MTTPKFSRCFRTSENLTKSFLETTRLLHKTKDRRSKQLIFNHIRNNSLVGYRDRILKHEVFNNSFVNFYDIVGILWDQCRGFGKKKYIASLLPLATMPDSDFLTYFAVVSIVKYSSLLPCGVPMNKLAEPCECNVPVH